MRPCTALLPTLTSLLACPDRSYLAYGPLLNRAVNVVFEGVPNHPTPARCWEVIDKYQVGARLPCVAGRTITVGAGLQVHVPLVLPLGSWGSMGTSGGRA